MGAITWMQLLSDHFLMWAKERDISPASMVKTSDIRFFADKLLVLATEMDEQAEPATAEAG